ncbi:hypothetical protein [Streptomyces narbonensis]
MGEAGQGAGALGVDDELRDVAVGADELRVAEVAYGGRVWRASEPSGGWEKSSTALAGAASEAGSGAAAEAEPVRIRLAR